MFKWLFGSFIALFFLSFNVSAMKSDNPFAKNDSLNIGKDIAWKIDKKAVLATKSISDNKGTYYHLQFDNKQLMLAISSDANAVNPKAFSQLEIKDIKIDGKQSPLFKWCLNNQDRHNRFLQQGLSVKKDICSIKGDQGSFVIRLNKDTLLSLQNGSQLLIMLKPFRTPLELNYDISDFKDMTLALNAKAAPVVAAPVMAIPVAEKPKLSAAKSMKKCKAGAPAQYKNIKPVEYDCNDASAKIDAERWVANLVDQEKAKEQKLATEREQIKLAEEKQKKLQAEKLKQEDLLQVEAAAIAASQVKQAQIGDEITQKMLNMCKKYWDKGEHRCYCQKYIEHAPSEIQASSTCK
jgi:hypothetical protein